MRDGYIMVQGFSYERAEFGPEMTDAEREYRAALGLMIAKWWDETRTFKSPGEHVALQNNICGHLVDAFARCMKLPSGAQEEREIGHLDWAVRSQRTSPTRGLMEEVVGMDFHSAMLTLLAYFSHLTREDHEWIIGSDGEEIGG